jgi:sulfatase maturation enzyme AslB (radical SAM superfamily)
MNRDLFSVARRALGPRASYVLSRWYRQARGLTTIFEINVEFVNFCNLRCTLCSFDHKQPRVAMSEDLLRKLLANLASDRRFRSVRRLNLYSGGETLLHRNVVGLLTIIQDHKLRAREQGLPFPRVRLLTNAVNLNEDLSLALLDSGALDEIRFSVDGGSRERFEELRKGAKWEAVASNIRSFIKVNGGAIKTGIICVIDYGRPTTTEWMTAEFREILDLVDDLEIRHPHNWRGEVQVEGYEQPWLDYCYFLFYSLVLLPNGDVVVCCADLNGVGVIGNLTRSDLFAIYDSPKRRSLIANLLTGRREKSELCRDCRGYYPGTPPAQIGQHPQ